MSDLRYLPDEELLVAEVLADVPCSQRMPGSVASKVPVRLVYKTGGVAVHPQLLDKPQIQVVSLAASYDAAKALAETARVKLFDAWRSQHRYDNGVIHRVVEVVSPFGVRTGTEPDGVFRVDATYQVWVRP